MKTRICSSLISLKKANVGATHISTSMETSANEYDLRQSANRRSLGGFDAGVCREFCPRSLLNKTSACPIASAGNRIAHTINGSRLVTNTKPIQIRNSTELTRVIRRYHCTWFLHGQVLTSRTSGRRR